MTKRTDSPANAPAERTLIQSRVFDAPREVVWKAWTDPEQLAKWFPPDGFTAARCELDVRPGGTFRFDMKGSEPSLGEFYGKTFPGRGVYTEVVPKERLAFTYESEDAPPKVLTTVVFADEGRKTKITIYQSAETAADFEALVKLGASEGMRQSLDKLTELLEGKRPVTSVNVAGRTLSLTRVYDAPRHLVWTAFTDPTHIVKWMFANDWESPFAETDVRPGGKFRIGMRAADRSDEGFVFDGTYREVVKPERLVQLLSDGRVMKTTFDEVGGKTRLTLSVEMAEDEQNERQGWTQILEHLAQHLATLSGRR